VNRSRVLVAILVVAVGGGIVALQAVDKADSRTPITPTSSTTRADRGSLRAATSPSGTQCEVLGAVLPATTGALFGESPLSAERRRQLVRDLRGLVHSELIASGVKPSLRTLARFFARAGSGPSLIDLGKSLTRITTALVAVVEYTAGACDGVPFPTTTSSTPQLR
jgi:hypothetical protein